MAIIAHEQVIDLIEDLPSEALPDLVQFIEFLRFRGGQQKRAASTETEAHLTAMALRRMPPEDQRRLSHLRARKEEGKLTPEEHAELLGYVELVELEDAQRARALVELSRLRKVSLSTLMSELGLEPRSDAR